MKAKRKPGAKVSLPILMNPEGVPQTPPVSMGHPEGVPQTPPVSMGHPEGVPQTPPVSSGGPHPKAVGDEGPLARRRLLARVSIALGGVSAAILGVPILGFIVAPLFRKTEPTWRALGDKVKFPVGETVNVTFVDASPLPWAGVTAKTAAWLRRESEDQFVAFSVNCAHLGCPVRWMATANLFMCPCHGGVYYADGSVAAGPPPHGLTRYPVRVRDGKVEIRTEPVPIG